MDDNFVSCLTFTDGTVGTLCASWTVRSGHVDYVMLHGLEGSLYVNVFPGRPLAAHLGEPKCVVDYEVPKPAPKYEDSWCMDVGDAFVRAARGQQPPFCSGEEGRKTLEVILAAEKSAVTGRSVPVKV